MVMVLVAEAVWVGEEVNVTKTGELVVVAIEGEREKYLTDMIKNKITASPKKTNTK
jgi:antitoxin (DNA-binding transcriptional repressor) of toxin-antitoxin stability system